MMEQRTMPGESLFKVEDLHVSFTDGNGRQLEALRGVSFEVKQGRALGLVGESGSGKSVTALAAMGLLPRTARIAEGTALLNGRDLLALSEKELCKLRGDRLAMVFQEPMNALAPVMTVGRQLREVYEIHRPSEAANCEEAIEQLLATLRFNDPKSLMRRYPSELSGGQKQRVLIAMAMALNPDLLIADEPTTALDVTTQAQIIELLGEISSKNGMGVLMITHDLGVVAELCDEICVMYRGKVIEEAPVRAFFDSPLHPYSQGLLEARPKHFDGRYATIEGSVPPLDKTIVGCAFAPRCPQAMDICRQVEPCCTVLPNNRMVSCHLYGEVSD